MLFRVRRSAIVLLIASGPFLSAAPASAQIQGACTLEFNGIAVDRIDTLDSPLELDTSDTLVLTGVSETGTLRADLRLVIGPVTIESGGTTYATPEQEFAATISLDDVSPYGVGLFRVTGEADGCIGEAWVRVSGRFPLATLTGLTALGLALGGVTGQLGAIVSRNRWARSAAALGGLATGSGIAVLAQQFGRLQISYPSLAATSAVAGILGFAAAWFLNPALRDARVDSKRRALPSTPGPARPRRDSDRPARSSAATEPPTDLSETDLAGTPTETGPEPGSRADSESDADAAPYWCYVMAPTDVFDLTDHTSTVAELVPGTWYLAKRSVGGWVHVVASEGHEGWVARGAIHRQG